MQTKMKTMPTKILLLLFLGLMVSCGSSGSDDTPGSPDKPNGKGTTSQVMKTVVYSPTDETFANPERGFYTEIESNMSDDVSKNTLAQLRNDGKTLVQILYYLDDYKDKALPETGLTKLNSDFAKVRSAGLKVILRFAYTNSSSGSDAPMDIVLQHMDQLKGVLSANKDVIACVQAGFIGAWGEWYYSSNGLNNARSYKQVLDKWLEILPADRCVQVRTPKYKRDYLGVTQPLSATQAYNGSPIARIAHHNDAFMADATNLGTYSDIVADKQYLAAEGLYLPIGGETCLPSADAQPSSGTAALEEMKALRWSFLNDAYDRKVLNQWTRDGVMKSITDGMGYRVRLTKGEFSTKHNAGSALSVRLTLTNVGFAAMYNPRIVQLVLVSADGSSTYVATLPDDPRTWKPNVTSKISADVALPADIQPGSYRLYLNLPDPEPSLAGNPAYSVRLANANVWDATTGYNDLGVTVNVSSDNSMAKSNSSIKFVKK